MNRSVLAFVAAVLAAALGYVVAVGTFMLQTAGVVAPLWGLAYSGLFWGLMFAIVVLLPLWHLFRRDISARWIQFALPAITLWAIISAAIFAMLGLTAFETVGNALTILPAGIASVVAFVLVIRGSPHA